MKFIAITLLIANAAYLVYNLVIEETGSGQAARPAMGDVPQVQLLSEVSSGGDQRQIEAVEVLSNVETIEADVDELEQGCAALGPFSDVMLAQDTNERMNALGISSELRAWDAPTDDEDFRVVLPPSASLQEAFRKLRELKSQDIDSYVITQGEDALGISLGVFSSLEGAMNHQVELESDGYEVEIREIQRLVREYWVLGDASVEFGPDVQALTAEIDTSATITRRPCGSE